MKWVRDHQINVVKYSYLIGKMLNLNKQDLIDLITAARFHDIGKNKIPKKILYKETSLNNKEFCIMKRHPQYGAEILKRTGYNDKIVSSVLYHHEQYNGKGYYGLKQEQIPLLSRIIAISDTFDAITSNRPYRNGLGVEYAMKEIVNNSGSQFDPELIRVFEVAVKK